MKIVALGHIVNHHYIPSSVGNSTLTNGTPRDEEAGRSDSVSALWHALQGGATPLEIAYQTIQDVAGRVTKKYPGHVADLDWGPDAGLELTHEFFTGKDVEDTLAKLLAKAPTEASFRRLLHKALGNFLQQLHRQTPSGRVGRRLTEQLSNLGAIPVNPSAWALPAHRGAALCDDEKTLLRVAYMIEFDPVEYDSGSRDSPVISNNDLQKMLSAVLQAAEGPVPFAALVRTISQRTGLGVMPTFVTVDDDAYEIAGDLSSPEDLALARDAANKFLDQLDETQLKALRHRDLTVRELADVLGVSRSRAQSILEKIREIGSKLGDDADPRMVGFLDEEIEKRLGQS